jgi:hypothetical protein
VFDYQEILGEKGFDILNGDMLPPLKKWGLLVRVAYRLQPKRAIPVCPTVLSFSLC